MDQNRIGYLLKLYADKIATQEESDELFALMMVTEPDDRLKKMIIELVINVEPEIGLSEDNWNRMWNNIRSGVLEKLRLSEQDRKNDN